MAKSSSGSKSSSPGKSSNVGTGQSYQSGGKTYNVQTKASVAAARAGGGGSSGGGSSSGSTATLTSAASTSSSQRALTSQQMSRAGSLTEQAQRAEFGRVVVAQNLSAQAKAVNRSGSSGTDETSSAFGGGTGGRQTIGNYQKAGGAMPGAPGFSSSLIQEASQNQGRLPSLSQSGAPAATLQQFQAASLGNTNQLTMGADPKDYAKGKAPTADQWAAEVARRRAYETGMKPQVSIVTEPYKKYSSEQLKSFSTMPGGSMVSEPKNVNAPPVRTANGGILQTEGYSTYQRDITIDGKNYNITQYPSADEWVTGTYTPTQKEVVEFKGYERIRTGVSNLSEQDQKKYYLGAKTLNEEQKALQASEKTYNEKWYGSATGEQPDNLKGWTLGVGYGLKRFGFNVFGYSPTTEAQAIQAKSEAVNTKIMTGLGVGYSLTTSPEDYKQQQSTAEIQRMYAQSIMRWGEQKNKYNSQTLVTDIKTMFSPRPGENLPGKIGTGLKSIVSYLPYKAVELTAGGYERLGSRISQTTTLSNIPLVGSWVNEKVTGGGKALESFSVGVQNRPAGTIATIGLTVGTAGLFEVIAPSTLAIKYAPSVAKAVQTAGKVGTLTRTGLYAADFGALYYENKGLLKVSELVSPKSTVLSKEELLVAKQSGDYRTSIATQLLQKGISSEQAIQEYSKLSLGRRTEAIANTLGIINIERTTESLGRKITSQFTTSQILKIPQKEASFGSIFMPNLKFLKYGIGRRISALGVGEGVLSAKQISSYQGTQLNPVQYAFYGAIGGYSAGKFGVTVARQSASVTARDLIKTNPKQAYKIFEESGLGKTGAKQTSKGWQSKFSLYTGYALDKEEVLGDKLADIFYSTKAAKSSFKSRISTITPGITPSTSLVSMPSASITNVYSIAPSNVPSNIKSNAPSMLPSTIPSFVPSTVPNNVPNLAISMVPSMVPSEVPSDVPSEVPSTVPSTVTVINGFLPILPSGGGGGGGFSLFGKRSTKSATYLPSLYGAVKGIKARKGISGMTLSGLGVRGIQ